MTSGTDKYKYESDKGNIFFCRCDDDPELASIRGEEPTGSLTESITFEFSKNSKAVGCKPRFVILELKPDANAEQGCIKTGGQIKKYVPVLKNDYTPQKGREITVNGRVWIVGNMVSERMR